VAATSLKFAIIGAPQCHCQCHSPMKLAVRHGFSRTVGVSYHSESLASFQNLLPLSVILGCEEGPLLQRQRGKLGLVRRKRLLTPALAFVDPRASLSLFTLLASSIPVHEWKGSWCHLYLLERTCVRLLFDVDIHRSVPKRFLNSEFVPLSHLAICFALRGCRWPDCDRRRFHPTLLYSGSDAKSNSGRSLATLSRSWTLSPARTRLLMSCSLFPDL
jgi:hypothetical protein